MDPVYARTVTQQLPPVSGRWHAGIVRSHSVANVATMAATLTQMRWVCKKKGKGGHKPELKQTHGYGLTRNVQY
eukprot:4410150-Karenia_brevis.AAC.1